MKLNSPSLNGGLQSILYFLNFFFILLLYIKTLIEKALIHNKSILRHVNYYEFGFHTPKHERIVQTFPQIHHHQTF